MNTKMILAGSAALMVLAACDPAGPNDNQRTRTGAVIGGTIGGLIGASSSDDKLAKGAAGAIIGGALGGAIGQRLDRQAEDLRRDIGNDQVSVENTGSELVVTLPQDLLFATDSASLRPDLQNDLRALAGNLQQYPDTTVNIIGHTDNTGSDQYNFNLSDRRANTVSSVLQNSGVSPARIRAFGRGETQPIASNDSASGRAQNRRVEIVIRPNT